MAPPSALARVARIGPWLASVVCPGLIAIAVARHAVNVPYWDEWHLTPEVEHVAQGRLSLAELWAQHNEHRPVLPKLVMLALARLSRWDTRWESAASVAVALALLVILAALIAATVPSKRLVPWLVLVASALTFSKGQFENWLWGWQIQLFITSLAITFAVWAICRRSGWTGALLGLGGAVAAALSFASGLVALAVVPIGVACRAPGESGRRRWWPTAATLAGAVAMAVAYLAGYRQPSQHVSLWDSLGDPVGWTRYVIAYLGAPLGFESLPAATLWGALGLVLFARVARRTWNRAPDRRPAMLPWLLLALFAILTAVMTGAGRTAWGVAQALSSRYVTESFLFWVSLVVLVTMDFPSRGRAERWLVAAVGVAAVVCLVLTEHDGEARLGFRHHASVRGRDCVQHYRIAPDLCLKEMFPDVPALRAYAATLERLRLGPFADAPEPPLSRYQRIEQDRPAGAISAADGLLDGPLQALQLSGWALDPFTSATPDAVLVVVDGTVVGRAVYTTAQTREAPGTPWTFRLYAYHLSPGYHLVDAYALLPDHRLLKLHNSRPIVIQPSPPTAPQSR